MQAEKYLMSFGQMIRLVDYHREDISGLQVMNYNFPSTQISDCGQSIVLSNELFEKLDGTWWEVEVSGSHGTKAIRSCYLGDSLQDALRLRPGIDMSYWCEMTDSKSDFLAEINRWADEECYVD